MFEKLFTEKSLIEIVKDGQHFCNYPSSQWAIPIPRIGETINLSFVPHIVKNVVYNIERGVLVKIQIII